MLGHSITPRANASFSQHLAPSLARPRNVLSAHFTSRPRNYFPGTSCTSSVPLFLSLCPFSQRCRICLFRRLRGGRNGGSDEDRELSWSSLSLSLFISSSLSLSLLFPKASCRALGARSRSITVYSCMTFTGKPYSKPTICRRIIIVIRTQ